MHSVSVFVKAAHGLVFVSEPNQTTIATTGSNQTFTWKLSLSDEDKSKKLEVQFGPWDQNYKLVTPYFIGVEQEPTGQKPKVGRGKQLIAERLNWTGDLSLDYYIAFQLVNIQRDDAGDYGIRFRVDYFPPKILSGWFTFIVQVRNVSSKSTLRSEGKIFQIFLFFGRFFGLFVFFYSFLFFCFLLQILLLKFYVVIGFR